MPETTADHAIQKFRHGLRVGAFVHGASQGLFVSAVAMAVTIVAARYAGASWGGMLLGPAIWIVPLVVAGLAGVWGGARRRMDEGAIARHLEARLPTGGLLLAAKDGAELGTDWREQLQQRMDGLSSALPAVNWRIMWGRPAFAFALLIAMQWLPAVEQPTRAQATTAAIERLERELEQVAELERVSPQKLAELRGAVRQLERRSQDGDTQLWRDIDRLQERIEQERMLAQGAEGAQGAKPSPAGAPGASASASGGDAAGDAPANGELADALQKLEQFDAGALGEALEDLPDGMQQAIEAARQPDGGFDPDRLPADAEQRDALGDAVAKLADELSGKASESGSDLAQSLADLADKFGSSGSPDSGNADSMRSELAEAAKQMADLGLADKMPEAMQSAMQKAMLDAALDALGKLDADQLRALLPDDLSQLQDLAKSMQQLAQQFGGGESSDNGGQGSAGMPQLGEAARDKLASLAESLGRQFGSGAGGPTSNGESGGNGEPGGNGQQRGNGQQGGSGQQGVAGTAPGNGSQPGRGFGTEGGDHAALRMTETTEGGVGEGELRIGRDDHESLPGEWLPVTLEKGEPEVGNPGSASPATGGSRPAAKGTGGGATWQLQLMPRHREVVRRYFAERGK